MRRRHLLKALCGALAALAGITLTATGQTPPAPLAPRVVVLGTVQDGGLPQAGCDCAHCAAARRDPALKRHVASLALHFPRSGHTFLVDATPDLAEQIEIVHRCRPHPAGGVDRAPFDGVFLTHAHVGHYLGLAVFGFEVLNSREIPVYGSPRMAAFLRANGPWSQLVRLRNIDLHELTLGAPLALEEGVTVTPIPVPHRDEYTDTLAFLFRGPLRAFLYVPDTDAWRTWPRPLTEILQGVDVALLDGTFYSPAELPDRDVTKIKHPLITDTMDLLEPLVRAGKLRVYFTHLNHSNPALDAGGPERRAIEARGFRVLAEGEEFEL